MSLSARSIAMQGLGFGSLHVALQGLVGAGSSHAGGGFRPLPKRRFELRRIVDDDEEVILAVIAAFLTI